MANAFGHNFPTGVSNVDIPGFLCDEEEDYCTECGGELDDCGYCACDEICEDCGNKDCTCDNEPSEPDLNAPDAAERAHYLEQARRLK